MASKEGGNSWSDVEDLALIEAFKRVRLENHENDEDWDRIMEEMGETSRTKKACKTRLKRLQERERLQRIEAATRPFDPAEEVDDSDRRHASPAEQVLFCKATRDRILELGRFNPFSLTDLQFVLWLLEIGAIDRKDVREVYFCGMWHRQEHEMLLLDWEQLSLRCVLCIMDTLVLLLT